MRTRAEAVTRLWELVPQSPGDDCWLWPGTRSAGYGVIRADGAYVRVHRLAYEDLIGPIPEDLTLDHLCKVRRCCNPNHLEVVTRGENALRANSSAGLNLRKSHCPKGHEYTPANTYQHVARNGNTWRQCVTCRANVINDPNTIAKKAEYVRNRRNQALIRYGGQCSCCGESTLDFLTLIADDGKSPPRNLFWWLRHNGWPEGWGVLCQNCAHALRQSGSCPHKAV